MSVKIGFVVLGMSLLGVACAPASNSAMRSPAVPVGRSAAALAAADMSTPAWQVDARTEKRGPETTIADSDTTARAAAPAAAPAIQSFGTRRQSGR
jgi:hypothetical protein